jgi:hypothetical protein
MKASVLCFLELGYDIFHLIFCIHSCIVFTPPSIQKLVEHSRLKDQFLRVAIKRLTKTQLFEDELKEVSNLSTVLPGRNQELETQLTEGSRVKNGVYFHNPFLVE